MKQGRNCIYSLVTDGIPSLKLIERLFVAISKIRIMPGPKPERERLKIAGPNYILSIFTMRLQDLMSHLVFSTVKTESCGDIVTGMMHAGGHTIERGANNIMFLFIISDEHSHSAYHT